MLPLGGHRMIDIVAARAGRVEVDGCCLLTSDRPVDDALAAHGSMLGLQVVRGHAVDLVARTAQALAETGATHFLRVNGDSPFFEPELARLAMANLDGYGMISNLIDRTFPYGVAVEWVKAGIFIDRVGAVLDDEREHVTKHLYRLLNKSEVLSLKQSFNDASLRLVVDTLNDYAYMKKIIRGHNILVDPYWQVFGLSAPVCSL